MSFFSLDRRDLLMIAACGLAFTAVLMSQRHDTPPPGPPTEQIIQQMAGKLGVTADQLRRAIEVIPPPARGERQSPERHDMARYALAAALNIPVARLDAAMRHRHPPPRD
ncbi:MAG: hypothetical protein KIS73_16755 [Enhydrobacter sp.]|nr:hypothetical protein [Enhydrobacter sp.]